MKTSAARMQLVTGSCWEPASGDEAPVDLHARLTWRPVALEDEWSSFSATI
jgi:hypothetical protein